MTDRGQSDALECRRLIPSLAHALGDLFETLDRAGDAQQFHPHPLTRAEANRRATYSGHDLYYVLALGDQRVLGYGMLRGWDAGFEVPSLGIVIHPEARGRGLGEALMMFLHAAARDRGARRIRLKVYPENERAIALYRKLGYVFTGEEDGQLIAVREFE